jgi:predicted secreted protein
MAETAGQINGTLVKLFNGTVGVANLMANEVTIGSTIIDVSSKSSAGWEENIAGRKNWSMTCESVTEFDTSVGTSEESMQDIIADQIAGTAWSVVMGTGTVGDPKLSGSARIANFTWTNPDNEKSTFSVDFTGTGALTLDLFA